MPMTTPPAGHLFAVALPYNGALSLSASEGLNRNLALYPAMRLTHEQVSRFGHRSVWVLKRHNTGSDAGKEQTRSLYVRENNGRMTSRNGQSCLTLPELVQLAEDHN